MGLRPILSRIIKYWEGLAIGAISPYSPDYNGGYVDGKKGLDNRPKAPARGLGLLGPDNILRM